LELGFSEILVILVFVLLIFGPDKLPEIARTLGKYYSQLMKYKEFLDEEIKKGMLEDLSSSSSKKKKVKKVKKKSENEKKDEVDEDLKSLAESLGIEIEGKSRKEIIEEIRERTVKSRDEVDENGE